ARQLVKLFPFAFVPGRHSMLDHEPVNLLGNAVCLTLWMHALPIRSPLSCRAALLQGTAPLFAGLFIYFINQPATHFLCLLFQTRYGTNCFAKPAVGDGAGASPPQTTVRLCHCLRSTKTVTRRRGILHMHAY